MISSVFTLIKISQQIQLPLKSCYTKVLTFQGHAQMDSPGAIQANCNKKEDVHHFFLTIQKRTYWSGKIRPEIRHCGHLRSHMLVNHNTQDGIDVETKKCTLML